MILKAIAGVIGTPRTILFVASATSTTDQITVPANVRNRDVLCLFQLSRNTSGGPPTGVTPSGFSAEFGDSSSIGNLRGQYAFKRTDGTESGTNLTGMNGTDFNRKILLHFRVRPGWANSVSGSAPQTEATAGNPADQIHGTATITAVRFGFYGSDGTTVDPITFSPSTAEGRNPALAIVTHASGNLVIAYRIYNSPPADGSTIGMDDEGAENILSSNTIRF